MGWGGDAWGGGNASPPGYLPQCQTERDKNHQFELVPTGPPKAHALTDLCNLWRVGALGQEVHSSLGVIPTIDTAEEKKKNEFNLLSSLIFHYYKNKYTSVQRREMASCRHMPPGGVPHSSPLQSSLPPTGRGWGGGGGGWTDW